MRKNVRRGRNRKPKKITLSKLGGDHGPETSAAMHGTVVEPIANEKGENPNNMGRRRRVEVIDTLTTLSMRQAQAAKAIRDRYCRKEALSSGGPIKERVQSSPKPDAVIDRQIEAVSDWLFVWQVVPASMRPIVMHVCCKNMTVKSFGGKYNVMGDLKVALDLAANRLGY